MLACFLLLIVATGLVAAEDKKKPRYPRSPSNEGVALVPPAWKNATIEAATSAELDALLERAQQKDKVKPAALASDDVFVRRVYLDLVGRLPSQGAARQFLADTSVGKRARLIDKLLASDDFARTRARCWRDVILSRATDNRRFVQFPREIALESWLTSQFQGNKSWSAIARSLITAEGGLQLRKPRADGQTAMLLAHSRDDGPVERTNDTVRVFLGISIGCAQCHDHPDDIWKRQQFHEMAAFFGRLGERVNRQKGKQSVTVALFSLPPRREYRMPDTEDPTKKSTVQPRFLTGEKIQSGIPDINRRKALANLIAAQDSYYFAAAFVNRAWGELTGQPFVPVDSLGPLQTVLYPDVLMRLAVSFRATDHDVKGVYRLIMNTKAYQRALRMGDSPADHVKFAGLFPTRLRPDVLWQALTTAVGPLDMGGVPGRGGMGPRRPMNFRQVFREMFAHDPSAKAEDVEGSVPQALLLMNNKAINERIKAKGDTVLARILRQNADDDKAIEKVYMISLGRKPTSRERKVCLQHIKELGERGPAFEDLLWSLINSAEFRTRR
jgi:hypothetical protein